MFKAERERELAGAKAEREKEHTGFGIKIDGSEDHFVKPETDKHHVASCSPELKDQPREPAAPKGPR